MPGGAGNRKRKGNRLKIHPISRLKLYFPAEPGIPRFLCLEFRVFCLGSPQLNP